MKAHTARNAATPRAISNGVGVRIRKCKVLATTSLHFRRRTPRICQIVHTQGRSATGVEVGNHDVLHNRRNDRGVGLVLRRERDVHVHLRAVRSEGPDVHALGRSNGVTADCLTLMDPALMPTTVTSSGVTPHAAAVVLTTQDCSSSYAPLAKAWGEQSRFVCEQPVQHSPITLPDACPNPRPASSEKSPLNSSWSCTCTAATHSLLCVSLHGMSISSETQSAAVTVHGQHVASSSAGE